MCVYSYWAVTIEAAQAFQCAFILILYVCIYCTYKNKWYDVSQSCCAIWRMTSTYSVWPPPPPFLRCASVFRSERGRERAEYIIIILRERWSHAETTCDDDQSPKRERERGEEKRKSCLITRFKSTSSSSLMHRNGGCVFTSTANVFSSLFSRSLLQCVCVL